MVLPVTTLLFWKFCFNIRTSYTKSWFVILTTQICIFILFISAGVLFECAFSLRVPWSWNMSTNLTEAATGGVQ